MFPKLPRYALNELLQEVSENHCQTSTGEH